MSICSDRIRRADTTASNINEALDDLDAKLQIKNSELTLFFCGKRYMNTEFAAGLQKRAQGAAVIGCTSAGEIGTKGYQNDSVTAVSFPTGQFRTAVATFNDLQNFTVDQAKSMITQLKTALDINDEKSLDECFALLLIDGLSIAEEPITFKLQHELGRIPLIGGSAGDELQLASTEIFADGYFAADRAVLILFRTIRPWEIFKEQHFVATQVRAVVTAADEKKRIIYELNGSPAADELAEILGLADPVELTQTVLAMNPLMLKLGDNWFIRAVLTVNVDRSLTIYCAIAEGLVLYIGKNTDMVEKLKNRFTDIQSRLGQLQLTIACDCILRRLELETTRQLSAASRILIDNNTCGFSTYGEQFGSVHINQTLTGIAIG